MKTTRSLNLFLLRGVLRSVTLAAILAVSMLAAATVPARAQASPGDQDYRALGLSTEQRARISALHKDIGQQMRTLSETLRVRRRALETVYRDYELDAAKARALNGQINDTQRAILDQHLRLQSELRRILTEDQFNRLQSSVRKRLDDRRRKR